MHFDFIIVLCGERWNPLCLFQPGPNPGLGSQKNPCRNGNSSYWPAVILKQMRVNAVLAEDAEHRPLCQLHFPCWRCQEEEQPGQSCFSPVSLLPGCTNSPCRAWGIHQKPQRNKEGCWKMSKLLERSSKACKTFARKKHTPSAGRHAAVSPPPSNPITIREG